MKNRPETTLFMLASVDGKISTGDTNNLDTDKDFRRIVGIKEGLQQYYNIEKTTDRYSLNTGRVMEKIGVNTDAFPLHCPDVSFIVIDNKPHLNEHGVKNLIDRTKELFLVTIDEKHPAFNFSDNPKLKILYYPDKIDFVDLFEKFKTKYKIDKITIQSGGTLNMEFLQNKLIDHVSFVYAPCLVGGKDTPTLIDGESLHTQNELTKIKALKLKKCDVLENSYIHLQYDVINDTTIED